MIRAVAPGKVVLWGEYAVLIGAPALVAAVDRFAACALEPGGDHWRCSIAGYRAETPELTRDALLRDEPPPGDSPWRIFRHVLQALPADALPHGGRATFDTADFHHDGHKLGLGSSAALCVAVYAAACRLLQCPADHDEAQRIHRSLQHGTGSGIDVAAAWYGGLLRFQHSRDGVGQSCAWTLPPELHTVFVWSGTAASTTDHLARLQTWRNRSDGEELTELAALSGELFETSDLMAGLGSYVAGLERLDRAAGLGVFSTPHQQLQRLASTAGVVYKPCGAGGGDVGAAFTMDPHAAERFARLATQAGFLPLKLEIASHGLEVTG